MPPFEGQIRLNPGQMTSSHWHPNSREILKHVEGRCSVFVLDSFPVSEAVEDPTAPLPILDFQLLAELNWRNKETIVPHAHLHYIINDGNEPLVLDTEFDVAEPLVVFLVQGAQGSINTENPIDSLNYMYDGEISEISLSVMSESRFLSSPPS